MGSGGRILRLGAVGLLGVLLGGAIYLGWRVASAPGPRMAPGWGTLAEMPEPRGETAVAVADGRMYVIGGLTGINFASSATVSILDWAGGTWAAGPPLPEARHHAAAASIGGDVYVSGGAASNGGAPRAEVWRLRGGAGAWEVVAPLPAGRFGHRMVEVGGRVYAVGGVPGPGEDGLVSTLVSILVYDPATDTWSTGAPMPLARDHLAVVVLDGEIWAIGGRGGGMNHDRVDVYDPVSDSWRDGFALPQATSGAAEAVVDGRIVISGGEDPATGRIVDAHWFHDPTISSAPWVALPRPPLSVHGVPGASVEGVFVMAGGSSRPGGESATAWTGLTQALTDPPWAR